MNKYKNKDGIELSFTGNDATTLLVKEVITETIKILNMYDRSCKISMGMAMANTKKFLKTNFDIETKSERSDAWRINKFNRNRPPEDQVTTIRELEKRVDEVFNS